MIRHVVMLSWTEHATEAQKNAVTERLGALPGLIPELLRYELGPDLGINEGNHDFVIVADLADREAYFAYRDHPDHVAVINETIRPILAGRAAVQYEL